MVLSRIFESDLYLISVLFSSSYATYIGKFKGRESNNVVASGLKLHYGDFMRCTFTKIRLLRGIRTFICRMLGFGMHYALVLYTVRGLCGTAHIATLPCHVRT